MAKRMSPKKQSEGRETPDASAPLGEGGRFEALKEKLSNRKGVSNPGALAAYIGRKKYGKKKFAELGQKGK